VVFGFFRGKRLTGSSRGSGRAASTSSATSCSSKATRSIRASRTAGARGGAAQRRAGRSDGVELSGLIRAATSSARRCASMNDQIALHHHRAFADRRSHALDRSRTDVADGIDPGMRGLVRLSAPAPGR
jgi:hypothetical protein